MTREEALRILDTIPTKGDEVDALEMAIEALEQKVDVSTNTPTATDCISRQAAIEVADAVWSVTGDKNVAKVWDQLKDLPSAQPEQRWVPVTERLPEKNGDYYVTYEKGYAEGYGFDLVGIAPYDADCEGFGIWQERYDPVSLGYLDSYFVDIKVTAWMPYIRPKPWKGESNE